MLWDLYLSKITNRPAERIWGIRFSPDETRVAIGFGSSWQSDPSRRNIVVVAVDHPSVVLHDFELTSALSPDASGNSIAWSPSGRALVSAQRPFMVRLDGEAPCVFPEESKFGGFLSGDRMVIYTRSSRKPKETEIQVLMPDCSLADSWKVNGTARVLDSSPETDLVAIGTVREAPDHSVIELVVSRTHEVKQRWAWELGSTFSGGFLFSDRGTLICSGIPRQGTPLPDVACWDTQTGAKTAEDDRVGLDQIGIESAGGDLLAITDYKYISRPWKGLWELLDIATEYTVPKRRLIWDARTGKEIAEWEVLQQKELLGKDLQNTRTIKTNFVLSLSPTGKYIAEGGSGSVTVYAVQR